MRISVIIPHLNQVPELERCLASLKAQTLDPSQFEIIVVDNGSERPLAETLDRARFGDVRLESEGEAGPGRARTTGAGVARGEILAFIDADCVADPGWLAAIDRAFEIHPAAGALGGAVRLEVVDPKRLSEVEAYERVFAYRQRYYVEDVGFCATLNMAVRQSAFEAVGGFGGIEIAEDRDWGRRAVAAGIVQVYVPEMVVAHPARASLGELCRKWDRLLAHDYRDTTARPGGWAKWVVRAQVVLLSAPAHVLKVMTTRELPNWPSRRAGLAGLWRVRLHRYARMMQLAMRPPASVQPETWNRQPAAPASKRQPSRP